MTGASRSERQVSVATSLRPARRQRGALAGLGAALALAAGSGCGAVDFLNEVDEPELDLTRMEADIRFQLQRDLESEARDTSASVASVGRVRCRSRSEVEATCSTRISRPGGRRRLRRVAVSIDPDTGQYRWEYVR